MSNLKRKNMEKQRLRRAAKRKHCRLVRRQEKEALARRGKKFAKEQK
jgi:hypothetical protein